MTGHGFALWVPQPSVTHWTVIQSSKIVQMNLKSLIHSVIFWLTDVSSKLMFVLSWYLYYVWQMSGTIIRTRLAVLSQYIWHILLRKQHSNRKNTTLQRKQQKDSQVPLIRYPWQYTNITNCTFKQPNKINAYIPDNSPFTKLHCSFVYFNPLWWILASFQFRNDQKNFTLSITTSKTLRYAVACLDRMCQGAPRLVGTVLQ